MRAMAHSALLRRLTLFFAAVLVACVSPHARAVDANTPAHVVVQVVDSAGVRRQSANAYLLEDPRVTSAVIANGNAGAWTDVNGLADLGSWPPGRYTVRVRLIGFRPETKRVTLKAGVTDTVRVILRYQMSLM
jgi:hypothetical protein